MPNTAALTEREVVAIQSSFARVVPRADAFAKAFYDQLFADAPEVRPLFQRDMTVQREKLVATLAFVVRGLGDLSQIEGAVRELGERHVKYKAQPEHYAAVGAALLATLQNWLGSNWTSETQIAWEKAYQVLSQAMIDAARKRAA